MNQVKLWLIVNCGLISSTQATSSRKMDNDPSGAYLLPVQPPYGLHPSCYNNEGVNPPHFCSVPPPPKADIQAVVEANPILAALVLSSSLHLHPKIPGHNHNDHLPLNPYLALLLSHYGKYSPVFGKGRGLYGYVAANNYHNNKPFGAYKIYEDGDG
ncbi:uncharacterized protein [Tenebrio molitor]|uniref:uncharacterized protein isoform X1 n=2 Tax=Tenebrio molitor TaxID=7067 RepID=UPI0036248682